MVRAFQQYCRSLKMFAPAGPVPAQVAPPSSVIMSAAKDPTWDRAIFNTVHIPLILSGILFFEEL